ncbi:MAG: PAS domain S-box protein [Kiritimatiellia bacterium]
MNDASPPTAAAGNPPELAAASEERYRLISSVATDYVFSSTVEPDGRLVLQWVAGAFEKITGYAFAEYVARGGWRAAVHPDDRAQDDRDLETLRTNRDLRSELRTLAKDGRVVWVEVSAHPVWDERRNQLAGIYGAVKDVTRRKQAEAESQATTDTLNAFVDSVPAFGAFVDTEERYRFVNRYHENWFKDSRRQFIGRKLEEVHRPDTYAVMRPYSRRALAGETVRYEHEMTGRDGKYYCFDVQYVPRRASDGVVLGYFSLVFDVTERVLRDRQLLRTQRLESVGRLASGIAHDLNNILSPVLMGADLLLDSVRDSNDRTLLDLIKSSAQRGAAILRQLLMFGRGDDDGHAVLHLEPLIRDMLKIVAETFPKNVSVQSRVAPDLPAILGNVTQLHQMLMNLCINARDAMPAGGRLTLDARPETVDAGLAKTCAAPAAGPHVVLEVADTGTGIPPAVLDKIFDPFFTTKPAGQGTGLGLSTVLGLVRSHRGFIRVDSRPGAGARFRIYLPAAPAEAAATAPESTAPPPRGNGEGILLVDDEASARDVARQILEQHGYRVFTAPSGEAALALYDRDPTQIQLVITDLMMPGMDGAALLRHLRQSAPQLKAIAMTGGLSRAEMAQVLETESTELLLKPFGAPLLLETVRRALRA